MNVDKLDMEILRLTKKWVDSDDTPQSAFAMGMNEGAHWIMEQPLSERLTEEEKEKINKWYECATDMYMKGTPIELCGWISLMRDIFGADLFKEK